MPASFQALLVHHFSYSRRFIVGDSEIIVKEDLREKENNKRIFAVLEAGFSVFVTGHGYWKGSVE